jgi:hypothetical protein
MGLEALRGAVVMPRHPEYFLPGPFEQCVVDGDRECSSRREQSGHDQIGQGQSDCITRPAGVGEQSVCAAVMPHLIQPGTGEHSTYRSPAGLRDQADNQPDEGLECGSGKARAELGQETGQRARCGGAGTHRRTTLTRTVQEPTMLSSSPSKIHEPLVTGVSPRPTHQRQRQETAKHEGTCRVPKLGQGR